MGGTRFLYAAFFFDPHPAKAARPRPPHGGRGGRGGILSPYHAASHKRKSSRPLLKWAGRAFCMRLSSSSRHPAKAAWPRPSLGVWGGRGGGLFPHHAASHKRKSSRPLLKWAGRAFVCGFLLRGARGGLLLSPERRSPPRKNLPLAKNPVSPSSSHSAVNFSLPPSASTVTVPLSGTLPRTIMRAISVSTFCCT